ncbi:MAG: flagellin [Candidatus Eisenbacteria bacterium]|nr:flagellin [Candidatus Eisenbacteria bacterium]
MPGADLSRINTNIAALNALKALRDTNSKLTVHQLRLATGKRINTAGDDPAGLVFAKRLESRARGLEVAKNNVGDVQNLISTAEAGVQSISEILLTMKEKILQAANDTMGTEERNAVESQLDDLAAEINNIVSTTTWGGNTLLDGTFTGKSFQVGEQSVDVMTFGITQDHQASGLTVSDTDLDVSSASASSTSLHNVNTAIDTLNSSLQTLGSTQMRVGIKEANLSVSINNQLSSHNRIYNADLAEEQVNLIKYSLLQQSATAMLSQANMAPQSVLQLVLGG